MTGWVRRYGGSLLVVVLAFAYITRVYNLNLPEEYMFDEVYHAVTAKLIARDDHRAYEWGNPPPEPNTAVDWLHPPVAKYFQALSILTFGENSFGWRFSSVVFGVLVIALVYHLTMALFDHPTHALLAAIMASLDGLLLVQSRIAMNDIFVTFFILATLLLYVRYRKKSSIKMLVAVGVAAGMAIASKWSGFFVLCTVVGLEALRLLEHSLTTKWRDLRNWKKSLRVAAVYTLSLLVLPASIYLLSYWQMFSQGKDWQHFKELHNQVWQYQMHLDATHPYQSRPWEWALDLRPTWYHVEYLGSKRADVYAFGNPAIFWLGFAAVLFTVALGFLGVTASRPTKKKPSRLLQVLATTNSSPLFLLVVSYCMVWLPWQLSPRIMFFYHYTPAVPLLCIVLSYWLLQLFNKKMMYRSWSVAAWSLIVLCFVLWYPHWVGIPVDNKIKDAVYFSVPTWK